MDQVAEQLAELRERRALTLRELAQMSGVAADTINQIELGHRKARPSTLRKLARALEIDVQEFYAEPALPKESAPLPGRATIIDVALDAARRQVALEKKAMFGNRASERESLDQRHANQAFARLRKEYSLPADDAEELRDFALKHVWLEEEVANKDVEITRLREALEQQEAARD